MRQGLYQDRREALDKMWGIALEYNDALTDHQMQTIKGWLWACDQRLKKEEVK